MTERAVAGAAGAQELLVEPARLRRFTRSVFEQAGMPATDADILAEHLVWADLRGISALGVAKVPQYLPRLRAGGTSAGREPSVLSRRSGFLAVDGRDGFGQVVGYKVMRQVVEAARETGIGGAVVRNTTSAGALGRFAMLAAEEQMIGIAINNGPVLMRAPGGAEKVLGNQAFAIASPAGGHPAVIADTALSALTHARIHEYQRRGEPLPADVAVTADGQPTTDPAEALTGILTPVGGHRGFGLAFMWEILTGVLSGGPAFSRDLGWPAEAARPQGVSMLLLAIDPTVSISYADYLSRTDELIERIHHSRTINGTPPLTVPGERSAATMRHRETHGIPIPADLLVTLTTIGDEFGTSL
jgi:LDH2 family malate/lactate/ureidoglycolate dehydrogenase